MITSLDAPGTANSTMPEKACQGQRSVASTRSTKHVQPHLLQKYRVARAELVYAVQWASEAADGASRRAVVVVKRHPLLRRQMLQWHSSASTGNAKPASRLPGSEMEPQRHVSRESLVSAMEPDCHRMCVLAKLFVLNETFMDILLTPARRATASAIGSFPVVCIYLVSIYPTIVKYQYSVYNPSSSELISFFYMM